MKITIVGAGAMGSLFGAYLSGGDNEVHLVNLWQEHVEEINKNGLRIEKNGSEEIIYIPATCDAGSLGPQDLVIFFVKSYQTESAVKGVANLFGGHTAVLTLQNGLGNAEIISRFAGDVEIIVGTTTHGATVLGPGRILHAGAGETVIGKYGAPVTRTVKNISEEFNRCGLESRVSDNITEVLWGKLLINAGINPLTALCNIYNGELVELESAERLMEMLVREAEKVAWSKGIELPYPDACEKVKEIARLTGKNQSSMLQDIKKGKPTEVDFINGVIVREGKDFSISTPCNETVTLLIKSIEERNKKNM